MDDWKIYNPSLLGPQNGREGFLFLPFQKSRTRKKFTSTSISPIDETLRIQTPPWSRFDGPNPIPTIGLWG